MPNNVVIKALAGSVLLFATAVGSAEEVGGIFADANEIAQARCVKIFGASIGRVEGYGTGIIVSDEGHILTGGGVMLSGRRINVVTPDGKRHRAKVIRRSQDLQAALLQLENPLGDEPIKTPNYFKLPQELPARPGRLGA